MSACGGLMIKLAAEMQRLNHILFQFLLCPLFITNSNSYKTFSLFRCITLSQKSRRLGISLLLIVKFYAAQLSQAVWVK